MMKYYLNHLQNESGVALVTGLVVMVLLTAIGTYAIHMTEIDETIAGNLKTSKQAFYVAEAGLQHAKTFLNQPANKGSWSTYAYTTPQTLIAATQLATMGTYAVTIQDAGSGARRLRSTGTTTSQGKTVIENLVWLGPYMPGGALTVGGNLTISGNPTVAGTGGGVHANGNLSISGNALISGNLTAGGTYSQSGNITVLGGTPAGGQRLVTIPTINPTDFLGAQDFRLRADGTVINTAGAIQPMSGGKWNGWSYSSGKWSLSGNTQVNSTLYVEGDASISGNHGSAQSPWIVTIVATGSIEFSGNSIVRPPATTDTGGLFRSGTENLLFVAGKDLKITGNSQQSVQGIMAAHEQVSVSGNATLTGFIIAEDAANAGTSVTQDAISGNMLLTYDGGLNNPFPGGDVQVMTWELGS
jgi:cytoskeletal protein CcmA (bactofilin family)